MPMRSTILPKNQSATCLDEAIWRTVHQRPPKKIAPIPKPAIHASNNVSVSLMVIFLFFAHGFFFLGDPMPRIEATDHESCHQERQCPGMLARIVFVQPDA